MYANIRSGQILLVEASDDVRLTIREQLEYVGYEVLLAENDIQAQQIVSQTGLPDLVLLDIARPGMSGTDFAEQLRKIGDVPIIFLSTRTDIATRISSLAHLGDDYVTKPVDVPTLVARVALALKRHRRHVVTGQEVKINKVVRVNFDKRFAVVGGKLVKLTPTEIGLLQILYCNQGKVVAREQLLAQTATPENLFVNIRRLRTKIEPDPSKPRIIRTIRNRGYLLA